MGDGLTDAFRNHIDTSNKRKNIKDLLLLTKSLGIEITHLQETLYKANEIIHKELLDDMAYHKQIENVYMNTLVLSDKGEVVCLGKVQKFGSNFLWEYTKNNETLVEKYLRTWTPLKGFLLPQDYLSIEKNYNEKLNYGKQ